MEQGYGNSRKRTHPLSDPQSPQHFEHPYHGGQLRDDGAAKRARAEQSLRDAPHVDVLTEDVPGDHEYWNDLENFMPLDFDFDLPLENLPDGYICGSNNQEFLAQAVLGFDIANFGSSAFPPVPYLAPEGQNYPQQMLGAATSARALSATYAGTSVTLSPRLHNDQERIDTHDASSPSQTLAGEPSFTSFPEFNLEGSDDGSLGGQHGSLLGFGDLGFRVPSVTLPAQQVIENTDLGMLVTSAKSMNPGRPLMDPRSLDNFFYGPDRPWSGTDSFRGGAISSCHARPPQAAHAPLQEQGLHTKGHRELKILLPRTGESKPEPELEWSNMTVKGSTLQCTERKRPGLMIGRKPGRRYKPLDAAAKRNALIMRGIGSCYPCRIRKTPCTEGHVCDPCRSLRFPICYRWHVEDFKTILSPPDLVSRFNQDSVNNMMETNVSGFTNNTMELAMSSGLDYPEMIFTMSEFIPSNEGFLALEYVAAEKHTSQTRNRELRNNCRAHIESIIGRERNIGEAARGDISMLSWRVFEAVNRYRISNERFQKGSLLEKSVMVHAMFYFQSRMILFTEESAAKAVRHLTSPPKLPYARTLTSRLVQQQIKEAMQTLLLETLAEVVEGIDKMLKSEKRKSSWGSSFCVVVIFCMSIEAIQVARDALAMSEICSNPASKVSRVGRCQELDRAAFRKLNDMFHRTYKTTNYLKKTNSGMGFNPLIKGIAVNARQDIHQPMVDLVHEIQRITKDEHENMVKKAQSPIFDDRDPLTHHMAFRKRNSGRLLSQFLLCLLGEYDAGWGWEGAEEE